MKGSIVRSLLGHAAAGSLADLEALPASARRLVLEPPTATSWLSEVQFNALSCALVDVAFGGPGGPAAYEEWVAQQNAKLFDTTLYRILFAVMRPERLLSAISIRWAAFHKGSTLALLRAERDVVELRLAAPPLVFPPIALDAFSGAFRSAVSAAGGIVTTIQWVAESPGSVRWVLRWEPKP